MPYYKVDCIVRPTAPKKIKKSRVVHARNTSEARQNARKKLYRLYKFKLYDLRVDNVTEVPRDILLEVEHEPRKPLKQQIAERQALESKRTTT